MLRGPTTITKGLEDTAAALLIVVAVIFSLSAKAYADQQSYWLANGSTKIDTCPSKPNGTSFRAANGGGAWIYITATLTCKEINDSYSYSIDYMSVEINPSARSRIDRPELNFDWVGFAVYQPKDDGRAIHWLYDEALPLRGRLEKTSREKIYFGNLTFPKIPKNDLQKATHVTFYMTSEGVIYTFGFK